MSHRPSDCPPIDRLPLEGVWIEACIVSGCLTDFLLLSWQLVWDPSVFWYSERTWKYGVFWHSGVFAVIYIFSFGGLFCQQHGLASEKEKRMELMENPFRVPIFWHSKTTIWHHKTLKLQTAKPRSIGRAGGRLRESARPPRMCRRPDGWVLFDKVGWKIWKPSAWENLHVIFYLFFLEPKYDKQW